MRPVRTYYPNIRLKRLAREPGGLLLSEALARAEQALEEIRESCVAAVDEKLRQLAVLRSDKSARSVCYRLSNEIFSESGTFGLDEISQAAFSLCSLLEAAADSPALQAGIDIHVDAMLALRQPEVAASSMMRCAVLQELKVLTARLSHTECAPASEQVRAEGAGGVTMVEAARQVA